MTDLSLTRLWTMRAGFAFLVMVILFFQLLPLDTVPRRWAGPDLILAFACAWALRRPDFVPIWSLGLLFLFADMVLQRPPGLWAAVALFGCEGLRSRARGLRDGNFVSEWLTVCVTMAGIAVVYRFGLVITLLEPPGLMLTVFELIMTMLSYPLVAAITHGMMGVRKAAPGDLDSIGGRT